jgi:adenine-specific DNA-methyltransferase
MAKGKRAPKNPQQAESYHHPEAESPMRPDVGTQAQFKKKKPAQTYRYDSSLSPELDWDGQNSAREKGEALIRQILDAKSLEEAKAVATQLKALSKPFLNWAGKAERLSFDVPTLPLFVHERLSTKAIIETLTGHKRDKQLNWFDLFGDPQHPIADQILRAYEYMDDWVNRMILGDSLVVMNSLLHYENLGGQVQMIYMDPPYGVKFGSNFQPFVRKRDVKHNDDEDLTREPEMVQAYRDTWELGLHSYLTYMRDRLLLCRELLHPSGSVFVQISDENVHNVRELMDEVFGGDNFVAVIPFAKTGGQSATLIGSVADFLLWYAKDHERVKYRPLYQEKERGGTGSGEYSWVELPDGTRRRLSKEESDNVAILPSGSRFFIPDNLTSADITSTGTYEYQFNGSNYFPKGGHWKTTKQGLDRLKSLGRLIVQGVTLRYVRYFTDFPVTPVSNVWMDTAARGWFEDKLYVVQTTQKVIQRCLFMTTDPGDLVLDPTCGSGTTAYVAEQWGRRWITIDVSRVPLALARQRLLTATFPWYELKDESRGPAALVQRSFRALLFSAPNFRRSQVSEQECAQKSLD